MKKLEIKASAKINFGLNIVARRNDGYHDIETVFYPVNLFDILTFTPADKFSFSCSNQEVHNASNNSVVKAVNLLEDLCSKKLDVKIELEKNIPIGAGMGGGSSDGATTLLALNELFNLCVDKTKLSELALQIGSDVPFFIQPVPSFATSRGEKLLPVKFEIPYPVLIINPGIHISTKWAYENIIPQKPDVNLFEVLNKDKIDFASLKNLITNDFEQVVFPQHREIRELKDGLYKSGALFSLMTGSGSTVFGIFENTKTAKKAKLNFPPEYFSFIHEELV